MSYKIKSTFALAAAVVLLIGVNSAHAEDAEAGAKTYKLTDLRQVVSNSEKCKGHLQELTQLTENPFSLQFTKEGSESEHSAKHVAGPIQNHRHTTLKNTSDGKRVHRIAAGSFQIKDSKFDYVQEVKANLENDKHHYLYPVIIAADDANCYYTALVDPSDETVAAFKKSIQLGSAEKLTDLHSQQ